VTFEFYRGIDHVIFMKTLGQRIRELREKEDLSLREFAAKLGGLSAAFLSDVELGRRHPSDKVFQEMARILKTSLEDLKSYDARPPIEDLKRLTNENPAYGFAFRQAIDKAQKKELSPEEIVEFIRNKPAHKKKS
jgi:transcriptional regulator with XRE-family HTH domain